MPAIRGALMLSALQRAVWVAGFLLLADHALAQSSASPSMPTHAHATRQRIAPASSRSSDLVRRCSRLDARAEHAGDEHAGDATPA